MMDAGCEIVVPGSGTSEGAAVERAAAVLLRGGVIIYPTDTIYGLGCLANNAAAVDRIYEIKGRPGTKASLVLVDTISRARSLASVVPESARRLMERFWPGPLTLILKAAGGIPPPLTGGGDSIGIRLPAHAFCRSLVERCGVPLVSTSANRTGLVQPAGIAGLIGEFSGSVDLIVNAGDSSGIPSTVVDLSGEGLRVVREGVIPSAEIFTAAGMKS